MHCFIITTLLYTVVYCHNSAMPLGNVEHYMADYNPVGNTAPAETNRMTEQ